MRLFFVMTAFPGLFYAFTAIKVRGHIDAFDSTSLSGRAIGDNSALPSASLPRPSGTLKFIALGLGTQNYTCPAPTSAPVAIGAKATLFDVVSLIKAVPVLTETIPAVALSLQEVYAFHPSTIPAKFALGHHYFNGASQPVFDLDGAKAPARLVAKRVASTPAPPNAYRGATGSGAIDWLYLTDVGGAQSYGDITDVYRVETAGGKAPAACTNSSETLQVGYAAEYWFYGP